MNESATITINPLAIRAVMPCAGSRDIRFYLNAIALYKGKSGGVLAAASDGNVIGFCFDASGTWEGDAAGPVLIRRTNDGNNATNWKSSILADLAGIKPGRKDAHNTCIITAQKFKGSATHAGVTRSHDSAIEDARFPDLSPWARPTYTGQPASFNPEILARVMEGPGVAGNHKIPAAVLLHNGEKAGVVVGMQSDEFNVTGLRYAGIVMPQRTPAGREAHPALVIPKGTEYPAKPVPGLDWLAAALG